MNDLGEHHFLGLEVENVKDSIHVSQEGYTKKIIDRFDLKENKRSSIPLDTNMKVRREKRTLLPDPQPYRASVEKPHLLDYQKAIYCFCG